MAGTVESDTVTWRRCIATCLRRMDDGLGRVIEDVRGLKVCVPSRDVVIGIIDRRIHRIEHRPSRIERMLDLGHGEA